MDIISLEPWPFWRFKQPLPHPPTQASAPPMVGVGVHLDCGSWQPPNFRPFVTRWSKVKSCVWQVYLPGTEFVPATSFLSCFPFIILKSLSLIHVLVFKKSYIACANFQFWGMYGWAPWPPRLLAILWCWDWKSRGVQHLLSEPSWPSDISDLILSILEATTFQLCGDVASLQNH